jgi:uncharacterized protein (DUF58 family)
MVRQFNETRRSQLVLLHYAEQRGYASEAEFELGVSVLASIAQQVLRDGTKVRIASGAGELRTATPITMLDDSSRIEQRSTSATLRDFARDATKRMPPPSVLLVVVGSATPIGDLRAASTLFGQDTRTIGLRMEAGSDARLGLVGGVTVATIGALPDLPKLMAKLS